MIGFNLFMEKFNSLSFKDRKELVRKIFGLEKVKLYTIDIEEGFRVFRIYDGSKYYKFIFCFDRMLDSYMYKIKVRDIYINCYIYVLSYCNTSDDCFSLFMKIIKDSDISYFDLIL